MSKDISAYLHAPFIKS